jgi:general secretion pathway protein K
VGDDFWATFIEPELDDPSQRPVSVWSQGKININTTSPRTLLSYICAWATPQTELCNDPTGQLPLNFLQMMSIAQGMIVGIPIFRSPKQLREALEGKGQFASFLSTAGIPPITFLSSSSFESGLSLESKVFSIYAEGYVRQAKRETVVRIMAVVDFRKAPTVQDLLAQATGATNNAAAAGGAQPQEQQGSTSSAGTPTGISGALVPSTGGRVVYYRVN